MPRLADADIERVKRQTDLLALVRSRGVELKKHGSKDWIGRCPSPLIGMDPGVLTETDPLERMSGWNISFPSRELCWSSE